MAAPSTFTLPGFNVEEPPLGSGSSGTVHKVQYLENGQVMAIKRITVSLKGDVVNEVLQELHLLYSSFHPNVVVFYGVQYIPDQHCITVATEFMDKKSLKDILRAAGKIPEQVLGFCASESLKGLVYLHRERKVIHRDIKPSNLLVNSSGQCKISDFGLGSKLANTLAPANTWIGSTTYMSPERISGLQYSWNSDVWSLGIALVECATGVFPYHERGQDLADLLDSIVDEDPPSLPPGEFSPEFRDFVGQCLQKRADIRPMAEMLLGHPWVVNNASVNIAGWLQEINV